MKRFLSLCTLVLGLFLFAGEEAEAQSGCATKCFDGHQCISGGLQGDYCIEVISGGEQSCLILKCRKTFNICEEAEVARLAALGYSMEEIMARLEEMEVGFDEMVAQYGEDYDFETLLRDRDYWIGYGLFGTDSRPAPVDPATVFQPTK